MNPYPFFDDRWNQWLMGLCVANVFALLLPIVLPVGYVDLGRIGDQAWVPGPLGVFTLFFFSACLLATLILWINMWMYWVRAGRSLVWLFPLLLGPWGPAIAFYFLVYRRDLAAFKRQDEAERCDLTHF